MGTRFNFSPILIIVSLRSRLPMTIYIYMYYITHMRCNVLYAWWFQTDPASLGDNITYSANPHHATRRRRKKNHRRVENTPCSVTTTAIFFRTHNWHGSRQRHLLLCRSNRRSNPDTTYTQRRDNPDLIWRAMMRSGLYIIVMGTLLLYLMPHHLIVMYVSTLLQAKGLVCESFIIKSLDKKKKMSPYLRTTTLF